MRLVVPHAGQDWRMPKESVVKDECMDDKGAVDLNLEYEHTLI